MRKKLLLAVFSFSTAIGFSQVPEDALRLSWLNPGGTARNQALGGAMGALGGDITSNFTNPAGIGVYRTSEVVLTPGFNFFNTDGSFRGTKASQSSNNMFIGTSGFVFGLPSDPRKRNQSSTTFSFAVNRTGDFNQKVLYRGQNDFSSFSEAYAGEIASSGLSLEQALNSNSISFPARMGLYTYLVDTLTTPGFGTEVVGSPLRYAFERDTAFLLNQENYIETSGGINELAFSFAGSSRQKIFWGVSLGIPILNYEKRVTYTESDATNNTRNYFNEAVLRERFTSKGVGLNLKLGMLFRPIESVRLGAAVHTPTLYGIKETYDADLYADLENYNTPSTVNVQTLNDGFIPEYRYDLTSPWKFLVSGAYVFGEVADVTKQLGFITADVEYVTHSSSRFRDSELDGSGSSAYFNSVNNVIRNIYKGTVNVKLGGELKFNTIMARAGFSYYGNPYRDSELDGKRMFISGGVGYRNRGFFVDLTYVHRISEDVNFPYRLSDKANTFASLNGGGGNVVATVGFKF